MQSSFSVSNPPNQLRSYHSIDVDTLRRVQGGRRLAHDDDFESLSEQDEILTDFEYTSFTGHPSSSTHRPRYVSYYPREHEMKSRPVRHRREPPQPHTSIGLVYPDIYQPYHSSLEHEKKESGRERILTHRHQRPSHIRHAHSYQGEDIIPDLPLSGLTTPKYGTGSRSRIPTFHSDRHPHFSGNSDTYPTPPPSYMRSTSPDILYEVHCECCGFEHWDKMKISDVMCMMTSPTEVDGSYGEVLPPSPGYHKDDLGPDADGMGALRPQIQRKIKDHQVEFRIPPPQPSAVAARSSLSTLVRAQGTGMSSNSGETTSAAVDVSTTAAQELLSAQSNLIVSLTRYGRRRFRCARCNMEFTKSRDVYLHVIGKCEDEIKKLTCGCGLVLSRGDSLRRHQKSCNGERKEKKDKVNGGASRMGSKSGVERGTSTRGISARREGNS